MVRCRTRLASAGVCGVFPGGLARVIEGGRAPAPIAVIWSLVISPVFILALVFLTVNYKFMIGGICEEGNRGLMRLCSRFFERIGIWRRNVRY